jgi:hypothetical protein
MIRTLTLKGRQGRFDEPTFILSENQSLKISVVAKDEPLLNKYKLTARHGNLVKTFTLSKEMVATFPPEWLSSNAENIEFSLALLDNKERIVLKDDFEIEPLKIVNLDGNFTFSAEVQRLIAWQEEHGKALEELKKRFDQYENNGVNLETF